MRKFLALIILLLSITSANADDLIDSSVMKVPYRPGFSEGSELNMSGLLSPQARSLNSNHSVSGNEYNLSQMRAVNPDLSSFPNHNGVIWLKHTAISKAHNGGIEITRLFVILGRRGLSSEWLNWNVQIPEDGSAEIIEASVYDNSSGYKISDIQPELDSSNEIYKINFIGLPENFILVLSWVENLPSEISIEGLFWFQENLPVWESIIEASSSEELAYKTFPDENIAPEIQNIDSEHVYTWRRINLEPANSDSEILRVPKSGVAFASKRGNSGLANIMKRLDESANNITMPSSASSGIKRGNPKDAAKLIAWLRKQPEITLCEGLARKIPPNAPWTKHEKIILAHAWLRKLDIESSFNWELPFEPDENSPMCQAIFCEPVLAIGGVNNAFFGTRNSNLLGGTKIFALSNKSEALVSRKIPESKASENRLYAIMNLSLGENGLLNGSVRIMINGAWQSLLLGKGTDDGQIRGALLALFPTLTNYSSVKYSNRKGVAEISFKIDNKPGVAGTGTGLLAILPLFEPLALRPLTDSAPPMNLKFPFVLEQNITLGLPKRATRALVDGKIARSADKINYSESYRNKRHRLLTESRLEVNMSNISSGNFQTLQQCFAQWHNYSTKPIPVR